jgi:hypothetical protein
MKIIHSFLIVILFLSIHTFGQTQLSKKETKEVIIELDSYRKVDNFESLISRINTHSEYKSLVVKDKKLSPIYDSILSLYLVKNKQFKESDSIINYFNNAHIKRIYCNLITIDQHSFNNSNTSKGNLYLWNSLQRLDKNEINRNCHKSITRKIYVDSIFSYYNKSEFEKCLPIKSVYIDYEYTEEDKQVEFRSITIKLRSFEDHYLFVKKNTVQIPNQYLNGSITDLYKDEAIERANYLEDIYKNGEKKIAEINGTNPELLAQFLSIKPKLMPRVDSLRKYSTKAPIRTNKSNGLPDGTGPMTNSKDAIHDVKEEKIWKFISQPSTNKITSEGVAHIEFSIDRNGKIIHCKASSPTFTQEELKIIRDEFINKTKFEKLNSSDSPISKGTFDWHFKF